MTTNPMPVPATCPAWCTTEHGVFAGEDDWLHTGAPLYLTTEVTARLCASVNPDSGATDGPYVIVNSDDEWTLDHTRSVGHALIALAGTADGKTAHLGPTETAWTDALRQFPREPPSSRANSVPSFFRRLRLNCEGS
jgi:hypothetical protein